MGVLIEGMKIPAHCWQCGFKDGDDECMAMYAADRSCCSVMEVWGESKRPDWCPLIELPDHGDLIDAEEEMRLMQSYDYDTYDDYSRAFDMLDNAPTIIPAERGEDATGKES